MARKTLLTEAEIRQFMKLANIAPLQEMGMGGDLPAGLRDDEKEGKPKSMREEEGDDEDLAERDMGDMPGMRDLPGKDDEKDEMEVDAEMDAPAPEDDDEEMEMDMDMGDDDMGADMDMGDEMGGMEGKEQKLADVIEILGDLLDLDVTAEIGGDEEMGGDAMPEEGGDMQMGMDAPEGDDEEPMMELVDDELNEDDIVQEVARRVAARLLREKKQDAMANKLAERIFRRLASK